MERRSAAVAAAPKDSELAAQLGRAKKAWDEILAHAERTFPDASREWKHYGAKHGWQVRFARGRRSLLYLIPHEQRFVVATALTEAELASLCDTDLPPAIIEEIEAGRDLPEGKAARVQVVTLRDVAVAKKLLAAKSARR